MIIDPFIMYYNGIDKNKINCQKIIHYYNLIVISRISKVEIFKKIINT